LGAGFGGAAGVAGFAEAALGAGFGAAGAFTDALADALGLGAGLRRAGLALAADGFLAGAFGGAFFAGFLDAALRADALGAFRAEDNRPLGAAAFADFWLGFFFPFEVGLIYR
jgi:hypothetical protein